VGIFCLWYKRSIAYPFFLFHLYQMKKVIIFCVLCAFASKLKAQSLAINSDGSTANSSAMLDIKSTAKGLLIPRMSKTQRNAIPSPANALLVYQNAPDSTGFYYYDGAIWEWLNTVNQNNENWKLTGNSIIDAFTNYIGTNNNQALAFRTNGFERMRLSPSAELGIGTLVPNFALDINYGQAGVNNCDKNGVRIKSAGLGSIACDKGFFLGYSNPSTFSNDALIWNYGQNNTDLKNIIFGTGGFQYMRLNSNGFLGLGNISPNYTLDVGTGAAAVNPCVRNGLRLDFASPFWECDRGLFMGFDNTTTTRSSSIWNFGDIGNNSPDLFLRFGFGSNFNGGFPNGEVMRILPPGKGVGVGTSNPLAMLHITNYTGGGVLPGLMCTNPGLAANSLGFYTGLKFTASGNEGHIWNYQNAPTIFGTNDIERMRITESGNVGIGENNPIFPLNFASSIGDKISLYGNGAAHYGFGIQGSLLQIYSAGSGDDIAFGYGGSASFTERMRIKGNGAVGIGINNPSYVLEVNGRSLIHSGGSNSTSAGIWFNNNANTSNTGFVGMESDNAIGFYGTGTPNGWGVVMNIATGNVGIGISNPSQKLHVIGNILASGTITPSDKRYKKNIHPIKNAINKIQQLNGVTYQLNNTDFPEWKFEKGNQYGLIAQEVENIFPEIVKTIDDKGYKGVDYVKLIPVLIEAIKEQQTQIDKLNQQLIKNK
jgi:Chaperone of endosialidase